MKPAVKKFGNIWPVEGVIGSRIGGNLKRRTMADKTALRLIGIGMAGVAFVVGLVAMVLVHKTVAGELALDDGRAFVSVLR
jgi:hypothetical protein